MAEPLRGSSASSLHAISGAIGHPDETIVRLTRRPALWACAYGGWLAVLGCFVAGGYPVVRTIVMAGLLLGTFSLAFVARSGAGNRGVEKAGRSLPWVHVLQVLMMAAVTGGFHSPIALVLPMNFSAMYARHGRSRAGALIVVLLCGGVLWMALAPRSWSGPVLAEPWFVVAASLAIIGSFAVQAQFVRALQRTVADAMEEILRARDELADHALARARDLELVGSKLSHELNNPLTAIKGLVQVAHRTTSEPTVAQQLDVVEREIERMTSILQNHLRFSRPLDRLEPADADLAEVADSVLVLLEARARAAGISLERRGNARATVDPKLLRAALLNVVANAIEACARGGRVEITLAEDVANVVVTVVDDGRGMTPEVMQRIGTPFFTTRERGTGLGVVLARAAFEQHGGKLEYRSTAGRGTTVVGTLPRPPEARGAAPA